MRDFQGMPNQTKNLAESGVILALMMLLIILGIYMPLFEGLIFFIQPVLLFFIMARRGIRWAVMAAVSAAILSLILAGLWLFLKLTMVVFIPGLIFAYLMNSRQRPYFVISGSALVFFAGFVSSFWLSAIFLGFGDIVNPEVIKAQTFGMMDSMTSWLGWSADHPNAVAARESATFIADHILGLMGAALVISSLTISFLDYQLSKYLGGRFLNLTIEPLPSFDRWSFPTYVGMPLIITLMSFAYVQYRGLILPNWIIDIFTFFSMASAFLMMIQGLAVFKFLLTLYRMPRALFIVIAVLSLFVSFIGYMAVFTGLLDLFLDYRRIRRKSV